MARSEGWNTYADGYDRAACDDAAEFKRLDAENAALRAALSDMLAGWQYIRKFHGDLYGVGWDRCEAAAVAALNKQS